MSVRNRPLTDASLVTKEIPRMTYRANRPSLFLLAALFALALFGTSAAGASASPEFRLTDNIPDHVTPGQAMSIYFSVWNVGDAPLSGDATINLTFPSGVTVGEPELVTDPGPNIVCSQSAQEANCTVNVDGLPPGRTFSYVVLSLVDPSATGTLTGQIEVSGGGASNTATVPIILSTEPIGPFEIKSLGVDIADNPSLPPAQAGSHPIAATTAFETNSEARTNYGIPVQGLVVTVPPESFRDVITHVPPGFIGNPTATAAECTATQMSNPSLVPGLNIPTCPRDSQIGTAIVNGKELAPVYNLVPPRGMPAEFGFYYQGVNVYLKAKLRPSDNGVDIVSETSVSAIPVPKVEVTLWGTPADSSHDFERGECTIGLAGSNGKLCSTLAPRIPFLRLPTSCSGSPLPWSLEMDTYQHPGVFHRAETTTPAIGGCEDIPFDPSLALKTTSSAAHSPSGLDVGLSIPQDSGPNGISQADLRQATVALPQGVSVNPAAADGLQACSDAQLRLGLEGPSDCPDASKLGSIELNTPLLEDPLAGSVYLRSQASKDPASGEMYRLAIELRSDERGVDIKLPGSLKADPQTGQLTSTFTDLPQLPFESMQLHLKVGPRAPLTTPQACGDYAAQATLTGWNGKTVSAEPGFTVDQNCTAPGFAPGFEAGVTNPTAGDFSPFTLRVTRDSGQPNLSRIDATLPEGELAKLAGVPLCPDAAAATGACPASTQIGPTTVGVGEGSSPLYVPRAGHSPTAVYLAGPYRGGPYSIVVKVPAQAGPFDLGTVTVRSALHVDPVTTRASVLSDPLPQIIGGVPVAYRDVRVNVDRPEFTINPTSCEPQSVTGTIASSGGQLASVSDRFQMTDCAALGFSPRLSLALKGATRRGANPALTATLRMPKGANVARASVALPRSAFLAQAHIKTICTRVQFAADGGAGCPAGSVYGHARAFTPLLDQPLEGPVYLRSSSHKLPDVVASLDGPIHVDLAGRIDSFRGGIRTSFESVPDAPVSKFVLTMRGGKKGLVQNSRNLCLEANRADARFDGQNGKSHDFRPLVKPTSCADKPRKRQGAKKGLIINSRNLCGAKSKANVAFTGHNGKEASANPVMKAECRGKRKRGKHRSS
jgi:hypothetical protein